MAKSSRGPSIVAVAARAGVSHQTVSRVLNGFEGIRPATRARVRAAIEELGYHRNFAARTLVTGRSHAIGMLGPELPNFGPMSNRYAVERAAREAGFHVLVTSAMLERDSLAEALDFLLGRSIDALVLVAQHGSVREVVNELLGGIPAVYLLTGGPPQDWNISIDQQAGVRLAIEHLASLGHRAIQHVSGPLVFTEAELRRDEFARQIASRGFEDLPVIEGDWSADSGYIAGSRLDPRATAVFCANDQMATGVVHALADRGLSVPRDVSVVGFDDIPESQHSMPPLTTVHQDFDGVGRLAVEVLVARLDGEAPPDYRPFQPWLVTRGSTGPRAASA